MNKNYYSDYWLKNKNKQISFPAEAVIRIFKGKFPKLKFQFKKKQKILDVGFGDGRHIYFFKNLPIKNLVKIDKLIFDYKSKKQCLTNTGNSMFIWQLVNLTMWYLKFFKNNGKQNFTKI